MTLHLWQPYHLLKCSYPLFSFEGQNTKVIFLLFVCLFFLQRANQCVSFPCVWSACHSFHFSSENSRWQFQTEILQPKDNCHYGTSGSIETFLPLSLLFIQSFSFWAMFLQKYFAFSFSSCKNKQIQNLNQNAGQRINRLLFVCLLRLFRCESRAEKGQGMKREKWECLYLS